MPDFLTHRSTQIAHQHNLDSRHWYAILAGLTCGIGSALTGTGGPLLLMPILVFMEIPTLHARGLAKVIQIPIATMATAGNLLPGQTDFKLGLVLALLLGIGTFPELHIDSPFPSSRPQSR